MTNIEQFLKEISEVCRKHKLLIEGCGCCASPYVLELRPEDEEEGQEYFSREGLGGRHEGIAWGVKEESGDV